MDFIRNNSLALYHGRYRRKQAKLFMGDKIATYIGGTRSSIKTRYETLACRYMTASRDS